MVQQQLLRRGIRDRRVLQAMANVPRERFVPPELADEAYEDCPLPIGQEQTISQPYTVAFMAQAAQLTGDERVLEVGTGSGYGAAVLSHLAQQVHSVERITTLARQAQQRLHQLGYANVTVHRRDGSRGLPECQPFDAIVSTAAASQLPEALLAQLGEGGRLVIPVGPRDGGQRMYRLTRVGDRYQEEDLGIFSFVPLVEGGEADGEE